MRFESKSHDIHPRPLAFIPGAETAGLPFASPASKALSVTGKTQNLLGTGFGRPTNATAPPVEDEVILAKVDTEVALFRHC
jgi:hypothetical protein